MTEYRTPKSKEARAELALIYGADGRRLLKALATPQPPERLRLLPAAQHLRIAWVQQYYAPGAGGSERWRDEADQPPASLLLVSLIDPQARTGVKSGYGWVG